MLQKENTMTQIYSKARLFFSSLLIFSILGVPGTSSIRIQNDALTARVDQIFANWDKPDSPGCALAIIKDGQIIYQRGYGMADLEHDIPIAPSSVFYIGSVSKQFTAFAIALLAQQGKLALDDDVRKYLPELPDYGAPITIRHLIHHTSGLRDYNTLVALAGKRNDEAFDNQVILEIAARQKELNFKPGTQYLYSNTGYAMLALVAERASGQRFSAFAEASIFKALGMSDTHFHEDLTRIVKHRADGYAPKPGGGFRLDTPYNERAGAGGLYTTVGDLLKWDQNFYDGRLGGMQLIKQMQTHGKLSSGQELDYAFALNVSSYKGLKVVEHGGALAGYRAALTRFPDQRFSVACLCNLGTIDPGRLVNQIADIYLADQFKVTGTGARTSASTQAEPKTEASATVKFIELPEPELREKTGGYRDPLTGFVLQVSLQAGRLVTNAFGTHVQLAPLSATRFRSVAAPFEMEIEFHRSQTQQPWTMRAKIESLPPAEYEAAPLVTPSPAQLAEYAGNYFSEELNVTYTIKVEVDRLFYQIARARRTGMSPTIKDTFAAGSLQFDFLRDSQQRISGFTINAGRVRNVRFVKKTG
jgi:CubicO group peptidase (beta-lactamase class C family)